MPAYFIGLMSGTSLDGIDAALIDCEPHPPALLATHTESFPAELHDQLRTSLQQPAEARLGEIAELDAALGELLAQAAVNVARKAGIQPRTIRAVGSHGQTVYHAPLGPCANSLQIGDPNRIAARTGITTVADFRRRDIALNGQGAPLATAFHAAMLRSQHEHRVVLNLGGMANVTWLPHDPVEPVTGFDTGPGNVLLDTWSRLQRGTAFDDNGSWAATGKVHADLLARMLADPYFSAPPPKSTGREHFNQNWLERCLTDAGAEIIPEDVQATLAELTARSVSEAIETHAPSAERVLVCGGGVHNGHLMSRLAQQMPDRAVESTQKLGLDPDWIEAMTFAWLARLTLNNEPGNLPSVTGADSPTVLGGIYPA
jgi:anhydro-N-acetylmuramic acid kinase